MSPRVFSEPRGGSGSQRRKGGPATFVPCAPPATPTATATVVVAAQRREGEGGYNCARGRERRPAHRQMGKNANLADIFFHLGLFLTHCDVCAFSKAADGAANRISGGSQITFRRRARRLPRAGHKMIDNPNDRRRIAADVLYSAVLKAQRDAGDFALSDAFDMLAEGSGRNVFRHVAKVIRGTKLGRSAIDDRELSSELQNFRRLVGALPLASSRKI